MRDRVMAECLIALAVLPDFATAWVMAQPRGNFVWQLVLSLFSTLGGSLVVFLLIVIRAIIANSLLGH